MKKLSIVIIFIISFFSNTLYAMESLNRIKDNINSEGLTPSLFGNIFAPYINQTKKYQAQDNIISFNNTKYKTMSKAVILENGHYFVKYNNKFYDSITGINGASLQGCNNCLFNSTDNFYYLEKFDKLKYSKFSKKLQLTDKEIRLFYLFFSVFTQKNNSKITTTKDNIINSIYNDGLMNVINSNSNFDANKFEAITKPLMRNLINDLEQQNIINLNETENILYFKLFLYVANIIKAELGFEDIFNYETDIPHLVDFIQAPEIQAILAQQLQYELQQLFEKNKYFNELDNYFDLVKSIHQNNIDLFVNYINFNYDKNTIKTISFKLNNDYNYEFNKNHIQKNIFNPFANLEFNFKKLHSIIFSAGAFINNFKNTSDLKSLNCTNFNNIFYSLYYKNYNDLLPFSFGIIHNMQFNNSKDTTNSKDIFSNKTLAYFIQTKKVFNIDLKIVNNIILLTQVKYYTFNLFAPAKINDKFPNANFLITDKHDKELNINSELIFDKSFNVGVNNYIDYYFGFALTFEKPKNKFQTNVYTNSGIIFIYKKSLSININYNLLLKFKPIVIHNIGCTINYIFF